MLIIATIQRRTRVWRSLVVVASLAAIARWIPINYVAAHDPASILDGGSAPSTLRDQAAPLAEFVSPTEAKHKLLALQPSNDDAALRSSTLHAPLQAEQSRTGSLTTLDWYVISFYGFAMIGIGVYYARRTKTSDDYYLGGRTMRPSIVGISLFATLLSTLSYLSYPGETIRNGPMILAVIAAFPLVALVIGWLLIPHLMRLRVTSAYELLETRFHVSVRLLGSLMFLSLRLLWMASIIYVVSDKVLAPILGVDPKWLPLISTALAAATVAYTTLGGLRAVVATDVCQTAILFGGAILTLGLITRQLGGFAALLPAAWPSHWPAPTWGFDAGERLTFAGVVLSTLSWYVCTAGSDQMAIQRYLATRDVSSARRVLIVSLIADTAVTILLVLLGVALLSFYARNPQALPGGMSVVQDADRVFGHYIVYGLPSGVTGLVIAALLAAAMSSLSSGVNSSGTVMGVDLFCRLRRRTYSEADELRVARWSSAVVGLIVVILSLCVARAPGNIFEVTYRLVNLFVAPLFLLFFLAMFVPWANSLGAWAGTIIGLLVAVTISFWEPLTGRPGVSFLWIIPGSFISGALAGCLISLVPIPTRKLSMDDAASDLADKPREAP